MADLNTAPLTPIYDYPSDPAGTHLAKLANEGLPDFVKAASADALKATGEPHTVFADDRRRLYPCHSPASTWLSVAYFRDKAAEFDPRDRERIASRLDKFAAYWGVTGPAPVQVEKSAGVEDLSGLPDSDFAYVWKPQGGGAAERFLPLRGPGEVKAAADWLAANHNALPYADRLAVAVRVLRKAAAFGVDVANGEYLERQAGRGVCDVKEASAMVRQRAMLTTDPNARGQLEKLAEVIEQKPGKALAPANLPKLAEAMDDVDRRLHLAGRYTDLIRPPEDVLFRYTYGRIKSATEACVGLTTGRAYAKADLEKLSLHDVQAAMGGEFAREVTTGLELDGEKLAAVASTLPRGDAVQFETVLKEAGIAPVKTAGDRRAGLSASPDAAEKLAAAY